MLALLLLICGCVLLAVSIPGGREFSLLAGVSTYAAGVVLVAKTIPEFFDAALLPGAILLTLVAARPALRLARAHCLLRRD